MKAVHDHLLPTDSAYYRARFPDTWFWADVQTRLAGKAATAAEKLVYLTASQHFQRVPEVYGWTEYGPPEDAEDGGPDGQDARDPDAATTAAAALQKARDIAAQMRADMAG